LYAAEPLHAQVPTPRPPVPDTTRTPRRDPGPVPARTDTVRQRGDTVVIPIPARPDSIRPDTAGPAVPLPAKAPEDSIKAPIAKAEIPGLIDIGKPYRWDREAMFASGAVTVLDLLERIPGVLGLRSGWIPSPQLASYAGDLGRVRLYLDGVELDPLETRTGGLYDLQQIDLWTLEDIAIERGASELRVYMRTWSVRNTTPYTRTDVSTGDDDTNVYRGFYGRRFKHGEVLQIGAQQYSTTNDRVGGSGDALSLLMRVGWAKARWSADAFVNRVHLFRGVQTRQFGAGGPIPNLDATRTHAYLRFGMGTPDEGLWAQGIAATQRFLESSAHNTSSASGSPLDTADTSRSRAQYVAAVGFTKWGARISLSDRARIFGGKMYQAPSARVALERGPLNLSVIGERKSVDSTQHLDAILKFQPFSWVALSAAVGQLSGTSGLEIPTSRSARGEVGLRLNRMWLSGGALFRDTASLAPPIVFDTAFRRTEIGKSVGTFASLRGNLWKDFVVDAQGIRWNDVVAYRPQYVTRGQLYLDTKWLRRFPSGNFGFMIGATHEYRSGTLFPVEGGFTEAPGYRVLTPFAELRILQAVISWQFRNALGRQYETIPGFEGPRALNYYGVRWEFWN
jgi:hypothetical protein